MRLRLLALGTKMPAWVQEGYAEYAKRLPRDWAVELVELPLGARGKSRSVAQAKEREALAIKSALGKNDRLVALEQGGRPWSTEQLARKLEAWRMSGANYSLLVGGPDGLTPECRAMAESEWSLSPLTLPHPLVRILVIEQLYRAYSILNHHPYHK